MLIRLNLALINNESNNNENISLNKLILPRRVYINRPVFISAYQLVHEQSSMVIDSLQENFKITSIIETDLEAAEEFPPEITHEERLKQFNTNMNRDDTQEKSITKKSVYQNVMTLIEQYFGTGNAVLIILISAIFVLLISIMIKLFT
jgi:phosphatidate phosphatase PAH1